VAWAAVATGSASASDAIEKKTLPRTGAVLSVVCMEDLSNGAVT